jgi:hypothetical protein
MNELNLDTALTLSDMSASGLFCQKAGTINIQLRVLGYHKIVIIKISLKLNCSPYCLYITPLYYYHF